MYMHEIDSSWVQRRYQQGFGSFRCLFNMCNSQSSFYGGRCMSNHESLV